MKPGDRVTGVPDTPEMKEENPTVTGTYAVTHPTFMGEKYTIEYVVVNDDIHVTCDDNSIVPANRRDKDTVL